MLPVRETPDTRAPSVALVRGIRWVFRAIHKRNLEEPLSWAIWLLAVAAFALWTLARYHGVGGASWVGMTIHTVVFAIWSLVGREWLALRMARNRGRDSDR